MKQTPEELGYCKKCCEKIRKKAKKSVLCKKCAKKFWLRIIDGRD